MEGEMNYSLGLKLAGLSFLFAVSSVHAEAVIKTALDGTFAPHAMPTLDGKVEGFNVDLVNAIGERLGKKVQITSAQFSGLIPALHAKTYDFLAAPVTVNEERADERIRADMLLGQDGIARAVRFVQ